MARQLYHMALAAARIEHLDCVAHLIWVKIL